MARKAVKKKTVKKPVNGRRKPRVKPEIELSKENIDTATPGPTLNTSIGQRSNKTVEQQDRDSRADVLRACAMAVSDIARATSAAPDYRDIVNNYYRNKYR